ncbi:hypothetical protein LCGC14_0712910 [marine sediment metagenome]|uniref:Uncharacterized protein n=1 Tax=marine sediment metagenome TaxID=412755 RepID=A0A0F9T090_9ZZZZ
MPKLKLSTRQVTKITTTLSLRQELKDQVALMSKQLKEIDKGLREQIEQFGWNTLNKDKKRTRVLDVGDRQVVMSYCTKSTLDKDLLVEAGVDVDTVMGCYKDTPYTQLRTREIPEEK